MFSIYAVLLWFCILREENDIDEMMAKGPIYSRLEFLEDLGKRELEDCLQEYARQGLDGEMIIERLSELELEAEAAGEKLKRTRAKVAKP